MDYNQTSYLVRESALKDGEPRSSITLDTSGTPSLQRHLADNVRLLALTVFDRSDFAGRKAPSSEHAFEILLGATANRLVRMEDMLNDCRNLLIDLEDSITDENLIEQHRLTMEELDRELGL